MNLIINGVDAMAKDGGVLTISTYTNDEYAFVKVSDSGSGITEQDRELIFEPFYTTKPEVEGTGLGLSVSYGIVSSHGGEITISSQLDKGSTFTVMLPL